MNIEKTIIRKKRNLLISSLFLLSMSLLGLEFPLAYLSIPAILIYSYSANKYHFLIQITLLAGGYGFYDLDSAFPVKVQDLLLIISIGGIPFCCQRKMNRRIFTLISLYIITLCLFAYISDESFSIQIRRLREYSALIYMVIPLLIFRSKIFNIKYFFKRVLEYSTIILIFYVFDSLFFSNHILIPRTLGGELTWNSISIAPFSDFVRKYPSGAVFSILLIYPLGSGIIKIKKSQSLAIISGVVVTKTMSLFIALIGSWFLIKDNLGMKIRIGIFTIIFASLAYYADQTLGGELRIVQFVEQFESLSNSKDDTDLAEFGSGRGAQAIPKLENLYNRGKIWYGFGFLHEKLSTSPQYQVINDYVSSRSNIIQAGMIEVTQLQTILDIGIIGLIIQHLFYIILFIMIRNLPHAKFYLSVLIGFSLLGVGGFYGLNTFLSLSLMGLSVACVLLNQRDRIRNKIVIKEALNSISINRL